MHGLLAHVCAEPLPPYLHLCVILAIRAKLEVQVAECEDTDKGSKDSAVGDELGEQLSKKLALRAVVTASATALFLQFSASSSH